MKDWIKNTSVISLSLLMAGVAGEADAQRFGGFRSSPITSRPYIAPPRPYVPPSRPTYTAPTRTSSPPPRATPPRTTPPSSSPAARNAFTNAKANRNARAGLSPAATAAPRRFSTSGVPLTGYRKATIGGGAGGNGGNGGRRGGGNGNGNGGDDGRRGNFNGRGYSHYEYTVTRSSSPFTLQNYIIYSMIFNHANTNRTTVQPSYSASASGIDMNCAVDILKNRDEYKNLSRSSLETLVRKDSPKIHDLVAPCRN